VTRQTKHSKVATFKQLKCGKTDRTHGTECDVRTVASGGLREMCNGYELLVVKDEGKVLEDLGI